MRINGLQNSERNTAGQNRPVRAQLLPGAARRSAAA